MLGFALTGVASTPPLPQGNTGIAARYGGTALTIDRFTLDLHVFKNNLALARKWYDNVVAATSYIGPMTAPAIPRVPSGFRIVR